MLRILGVNFLRGGETLEKGGRKNLRETLLTHSLRDLRGILEKFHPKSALQNLGIKKSGDRPKKVLSNLPDRAVPSGCFQC